MWRLLGGFKIYAIVAVIAFSAGNLTMWKICSWMQDAAIADQLDSIYDAEEDWLELNKERKEITKKQYKEVKEYVKNNPTRPGLTDDELLLINRNRTP